MRIGLPGNYLPLSGGTMTGTLTLGGQKLQLTNAVIKDGGVAAVYIRNAADNGFQGIQADLFLAESGWQSTQNNTVLMAKDTDANILSMRARDTGVGLVNVARLVGAADPYLEATLPMVLYPAAIPGTLVEGHHGYDSASDKLWYRDASATKKLFPVKTVASDGLQYSNDGVKSTQAITYTKIKEIALNDDVPACRLKFDLQCDHVARTGYGKVYKNWAPIGTEQTVTNQTYQTKSEDFTGWVKGDLIQIYAYVSVADVAVDVRNMRIYFDLAIDLASPTNQDPA